MGLCSELVRIYFIQTLNNTNAKNLHQFNESLEIYLLTLVTTLKSQLKCEMITEARLVTERSDEVLLKQNIIKPEHAAKHPITINFLNW